MKRTNLATIIIVVSSVTAVDIIRGQVCEFESCRCVSLSADFPVKPRTCHSGEACDIRDNVAICYLRRFSEYRVTQHVYQCYGTMCLNGEYCQRHRSGSVCSKTSLKDYQTLYAQQKCAKPQGCLCKPNPENEETWKIVWDETTCQEEEGLETSLKCNADYCFCSAAGADCLRGQYCVGGHFKGCSFNPFPGSKPITLNQLCDTRDGCLCTAHANDVAFNHDPVYCSYAQTCTEHWYIGEFNTKPHRFFRCDWDPLVEQFECKRKNCIFTKTATCLRGEFFLKKAGKCMAEPLGKIEIGEGCATSAGCICMLPENPVSHRRPELLVQRRQVCGFDPEFDHKYLAPAHGIDECLFDFCRCDEEPNAANPRFCIRGQLCLTDEYSSGCVSPGFYQQKQLKGKQVLI